MNTQAAKKLAASKGMRLEYTNFGEGNKRMWYLFPVVDSPLFAKAEPMDFSSGELAKTTPESLTKWIDYICDKAKSA